MNRNGPRSCSSTRAWRHIDVRTRRMKKDRAEVVTKLVEVHYAEAERITLVMDNLNMHTMTSLYELFEPERACQIACPLDIRYIRSRAVGSMWPRSSFRSLGGSVLATHGGSAGGYRSGLNVGVVPQRGEGIGRLALHDRRCTHQARAVTSIKSRLTER